jgi:hypothetical protein
MTMERWALSCRTEYSKSLLPVQERTLRILTKSKETIEKEISVQESMTEFFTSIELGVDTFKTINGNEFTITSVDDKHINISIPEMPR